MKKSISITVPEYLTVEQYDKLSSIETEDKLEKIVQSLSALTKYTEEEVRTWSIPSLKEVYEQYTALADWKQEFHSLLEFNGELHGYSDIKSMTLGCYVDIENICKDLNGNLHKLAAILYRPVSKHRFDTLSFTYRQKLKMVNNKVENVFKWYELDEYDLDKRLDVEEKFKQFPAHILLGALSFFLSTGNLYLSDTQSLEGMSENSRIMMKKLTLRNLSQNIGAGGGLYTNSVSPIFLQLQETKPSQILTL